MQRVATGRYEVSSTAGEVVQAFVPAPLPPDPVTSISQIKGLSGLSFPTASKAIETLAGLGIAREITGGRRNRLFVYDAYRAIPSEGTEPP